MGTEPSFLRWGPRTLRWQLILLTLLVTLGVSLAVSAVVRDQLMRLLGESTDRMVRTEFSQAGANIRALTGYTESLVRILYTEDATQTLLAVDPLDPVEYVTAFNRFSEVLGAVMFSHEALHSVVLYPSTGNVLGYDRVSSILNEDPRDFDAPFLKAEPEAGPRLSVPGTRWIGGRRTSCFWGSAIQGRPQDRLVMAAVKTFGPVGTEKKAVTLVLNLEERAFFRFFQELDSGTGLGTSLVDRRGTVLSTQDEANIGKPSPWFPWIDWTQPFGSSIVTHQGASYQLVWSLVGGPDWVLVKAVPLSVYQAGTNHVLTTVFASFLLAMAVLILAISLLVVSFTRYLPPLASAMEQLGAGRWGVTLPVLPRSELGTVIASFNAMSLQMKHLVHENQRVEAQKRSLEIATLYQQINPHFVFNTLNSIKWMARISNAPNVADAIADLGQILVPQFRNNTPFCRLGEELSYLEVYVRIMKARYGAALEMETRMAPELLDFRIPRFLLQPLVENAIEHGILARGPGGSPRVVLGACLEGARLRLTVSDEGAGIPRAILAQLQDQLAAEDFTPLGQGIGLINVHRRIQLYYGPGCGLSLASEPGRGTTVTAELPAEREPAAGSSG